MPKLKLDAIFDEKPIKLAVELPATLHRDLVAYAEALGRETDQPIKDPTKLIVPMLARFIAGDRGFARTRRSRKSLPALEKTNSRDPAPSSADALANATQAGSHF